MVLNLSYFTSRCIVCVFYLLPLLPIFLKIGHVDDKTFLVNIYILKELWNCLNLSFRYNNHFNFSLDNIFWIVNNNFVALLWNLFRFSSFKKKMKKLITYFFSKMGLIPNKAEATFTLWLLHMNSDHNCFLNNNLSLLFQRPHYQDWANHQPDSQSINTVKVSR